MSITSTLAVTSLNVLMLSFRIAYFKYYGLWVSTGCATFKDVRFLFLATLIRFLVVALDFDGALHDNGDIHIGPTPEISL